VFYGPTPYLSQADSPFTLGAPNFCLETFESGTLDVPDVTGNGSVVPPGGLTDSVDGDDGVIDGSGLAGHSYFSPDGAGGITFTFDPTAPLGLPTLAGMVWTDGGAFDSVTFEAFDQNGTSLGTVGPNAIADGSNSGTTAEDRFYGVGWPGGISAIKLSNPSGGIEVDHLQFNDCAATTTTTTSTTETTTSTTTTSTTTTTTSSTSSTTASTTSSTSTSTAPTTTTHPATTTTTTLPSGDCAGVEVGPSFPSLNCRITALLAEVQTESALGNVQQKLVHALQIAKARKEDGETKCASGDVKHARKRLQQAGQKLAQFSHRLRSNSARKEFAEEIREPLAVEADGIKADAKMLHDHLACSGG
jgi:hypothetical protein